MDILKRLITVSSLILVLAATCLADGPTCSQDPGQTSTPPCPLVHTISDPTDPAEAQALQTTNSFDVVAIGEIAIGTFLSLL
jgi:hypothetical protein